jgi:antitoxin component YwqK of YwqJK toxin-antitoxin module
LPLYGSFVCGIKILKLADNQAEQRQIGQCTRKKIEAVLILINNTIKTPIIKLKMASLSLNEQMTILQKQQTTLAEKIKQEEERKRKQQLTLQTLQNLNEQQNKAIKTYKSKDGKYRGRFELQQTNIMTAPFFEVILEILKKQDERIVELEAIITKHGISSN